MSTAIAAKARSEGKSLEQIDLAAEGIETDDFLVDTALAHGLKVNFGAAITSGSLERSIEGANTITITVHDGKKEVLRSGMFGTKDNTKLPVLDVLVEGLWYRLARFSKEGLELTLEFEDRYVWFLRSHTKPMSASRAHTTRAEFIGRMVKEVKHLKYFCPELHKRQPIEGEHGVTGYTIDKKTGKKKPKTKKIPESQRKRELAGGLLSTTDLEVEGVPLNKNQLQVAEEVLDTGSEMGANRKVLVSSIMCIMQESKMHNDAGHGGVDVGPFNQNSKYWPASGDVKTDARAYFKKAIENDKKEPRYTLADLVQSVQNSGAGASFYAKHKDDAEAVVAEYGEKGISANHEHQITKEYDFHRGPPDGPAKEDSWEASDRLAKEVNWRRFVRGATFYFVQDSDLMKAKPYAEIEEDDEGIEEINGTIDAGMPTSEALVHCRAERWWCPPGAVVKVKNCGPFTGRWLVFKIKRDLFSPQAEVTIHQPEAAKPEKASEKINVGKSGSGETIINGSHVVTGETPRDRIVEAARWGLDHKSHFKYAEVRPMPKSLFQNSVVTDCSGFATLCYKGAGVRDPNRFGYDGSGNTVSLRNQGNKSHTPEPGDLAFYASPEHVGVYIGEGKVIEFGGPGGPREEPVHYRNDFLEYRNYSLESVPWGKESAPEPRGGKPTPKTKQKEPPEQNLRAPIGKEGELIG